MLIQKSEGSTGCAKGCMGGKEGTHAAGRVPERELLYSCRSVRDLKVPFEPHAAGMLPARHPPKHAL